MYPLYKRFLVAWFVHVASYLVIVLVGWGLWLAACRIPPTGHHLAEKVICVAVVIYIVGALALCWWTFGLYEDAKWVWKHSREAKRLAHGTF